MHYGHKRMIFEKDVAIQVRDGTVWLKHQRALKLEPGEIVPVEIEIWPPGPLYCTAITIFPKCPPVAWCA
jgi:hypothetical protein